MKHLININFANITLHQIQNAVKSVKKLNAYPCFSVDESFNPFIFEKYLSLLKTYKSKGYILLNAIYKSFNNAKLILNDYKYTDRVIYEINFNYLHNKIINNPNLYKKDNLKSKISSISKIRKDIKRIYKNNEKYVPNLKLGHKINSINTTFIDEFSNSFMYKSDFDFIKYTFTWPEKNVAGGLFNPDGSISYELRDSLASKIDFFNKSKTGLKIFIPQEYFFNNFFEEQNFDNDFNDVFIDLNFFIKTWNKLLFPIKGDISLVYNLENIFNEKTIIIPGLDWISASTEKQLVKYCSSGNTLIISPKIPKYNEDGNFQGLLKEEILKSKEISFGNKTYVLKLYQIGKGSLVFFDFINNKSFDINMFRNLINKVL